MNEWAQKVYFHIFSPNLFYSPLESSDLMITTNSTRLLFFFCSLSRTAQFFKSIFNCISNIFKAMFQHFQNIVISLLLEIIFYFKKISWLRQNKYPVSAEMLCNICMWSKPNIWLFGLLSILYFICFQVIPKWIPSYPFSLELQVNVILTLDNHLIY